MDRQTQSDREKESEYEQCPPPGQGDGGWRERRPREEGGPGPLRHYGLGEGRWGAGRAEAGGGSVLTQASCGDDAGPGAAGRRAVSSTAPPRMRCH